MVRVNVRITTSANRTGGGCRLRGSTVHVHWALGTGHCALRALSDTITVLSSLRLLSLPLSPQTHECIDDALEGAWVCREGEGQPTAWGSIGPRGRDSVALVYCTVFGVRVRVRDVCTALGARGKH